MHRAASAELRYKLIQPGKRSWRVEDNWAKSESCSSNSSSTQWWHSPLGRQDKGLQAALGTDTRHQCCCCCCYCPVHRRLGRWSQLESCKFNLKQTNLEPERHRRGAIKKARKEDKCQVTIHKQLEMSNLELTRAVPLQLVPQNGLTTAKAANIKNLIPR